MAIAAEENKEISITPTAELGDSIQYSDQFRERLDVLQSCVAYRHTSRVPHFSNFFTWKILDSDLKPKLSEALADYGMLDRIQCEFQERYNFDCHYNLNTRNLLKPSDVLGGHHHHIDDERESINFFDQPLMEDGEYLEYVNHRDGMNWRMFLRKYPDIEAGKIAEGIILNFDNAKFTSHIDEKFVTKYGCPDAYGPCIVQVPYERFHKYLRGIKNGTLDLRRHSAECREVFDRIQKEEIMPYLEASLKKDTSMYMNDTMTALLAHTMLSQKQWDEFYWPYQKQYFDAILASGKNVMVYVEDSIIRFKEYFQDYPKGFLTIVPERDDVFELREAIPNATIVGGISTQLLGNGTPEECVERTKRVIDGMGDGFVLGQDKMVSFRNDCRRENLLAVCDYVQNFRW